MMFLELLVTSVFLPYPVLVHFALYCVILEISPIVLIEFFTVTEILLHPMQFLS